MSENSDTPREKKEENLKLSSCKSLILLRKKVILDFP